MHITWIPTNESIAEHLFALREIRLLDGGHKPPKYSWGEYALPDRSVPWLRNEKHVGDPRPRTFIASYDTEVPYEWVNIEESFYDEIMKEHGGDLTRSDYGDLDGYVVADWGLKGSAIPLVRSECTPDHVGCLFFIAVPAV